MSNNPFDQGIPVIPPIPEAPKDLPYDGTVAICGLCGMKIKRVMGYVCYNDRCGVFPQPKC